MGSSVTAGLSFKLQRLTREYGAHSHGTLERLSVAGTGPAIDVYRASVQCNSYKLANVKGLCWRFQDFDMVKTALKEIILSEVEVVPLQFVIPRSHRAMYVIAHLFLVDLEY